MGVGFEVSNVQAMPSVVHGLLLLTGDQDVEFSSTSSTMTACMLPCFLWRPEDGVISARIGVTGCYELADVETKISGSLTESGYYRSLQGKSRHEDLES